MKTGKSTNVKSILELKKGTLVRVILNNEKGMTKPNSLSEASVGALLDSDVFDGIAGRFREIVGYLVKRDRKEQSIIINPFGRQHGGPHRNGYPDKIEYFMTDGISIDLDYIKSYKILEK